MITRLLILSMAGATFGCSDIAGPREERILQEVGLWVAGDAAAAIGNDGRFVLDRNYEDDPRVTIDDERAILLAITLNRSVLANGGGISQFLDEWRGERIDFDNLTADPRVYFVETPYEPFPVPASTADRRGHGSWYLVWLEDSLGPVASVAVSSAADHLSINQDGALVSSGVGGNDFWELGTPAHCRFTVPLTPEQAVVYVGESTGVKTVEVPELFRPAEPLFPQISYWRIVLQRSVAVTDEDRAWRRDTSVLFIRSQSRGKGDVAIDLALPAAEQPTSEVVAYFTEEGEVATVSLPIRNDRPARFTNVELVNLRSDSYARPCAPAREPLTALLTHRILGA